MNPTTKIFVVIKGGLVTAAYSNDPQIELNLFDLDDLESEGMLREQEDKLYDKLEKEYHPIY